MTEKDIQKMMKSLDLTRDEAIEMLLEDEAVDKMSMKEVNDDLTAEQKKVVKKASSTQSKPHEKVKRERKVDTEKQFLIECLVNGLKSTAETSDIQTKNEVEINFKAYGNDYTVKLIKHRPPKASKQDAFFLFEKEQMFSDRSKIFLEKCKNPLTNVCPHAIITL